MLQQRISLHNLKTNAIRNSFQWFFIRHWGIRCKIRPKVCECSQVSSTHRSVVALSMWRKDIFRDINSIPKNKRILSNSNLNFSWQNIVVKCMFDNNITSMTVTGLWEKIDLYFERNSVDTGNQCGIRELLRVRLSLLQ